MNDSTDPWILAFTLLITLCSIADGIIIGLIITRLITSTH